MNTDYLYNMRQQPAIDIVIDSIASFFGRTPVIRQQSLAYVGLAFNTSEVCLNANPAILFLLLNGFSVNNEGATRGLYFCDEAGNNLCNLTNVTGSSILVNETIKILFHRIRYNAGGGFVANAATTVNLNVLRIS